MLYKNNARMSEQKQKYALRKLPIGVASVLLGTVAVGMGSGQTVHADTTTDNTASQQVAENKLGGKLTDKVANSQQTTNNTPQDKDISTTNTLNVNQANNNQKAVQNNVQNTAATLTDNKVATTNNNQQQVNQALKVNLAKTNTNSMYQGEATNYNYSLTDTYNGGAGTPLPKENSLGFIGDHHIGVKGNFTLKTADLKKGNKIYLGSIKLSNSLNDNSHNIWLSSTKAGDLSPVDYLGHFIGYIVPYQDSSDHADLYLRVDQENNFNTPTIEISNWLQNDVWAYNWQSDPKSFKGVPNNFTENLTMPDGTTYHFNMYNNIKELSEYKVHTASTIGTHSFNLYDYASPAIAKNGGNGGQIITGSDFDKLNNGGAGIVVPNTGYQMFYSFKNEKNQSAPSVLNTNYHIPVKNKNNKLTYETLLLGASMINYQNAGSNLTQQDLIAKSKPGTALYSLQNDGTYLCYINLTPEQITMNKQTLTDFLKANSKVVAIDGDQALQNTVNYYFNDNFKGRSLNYVIVTHTGQLTPYDQSSVSSRKVIDPANGQTIIDLGTYTGKTDDLQLKGKSGIRIHYINSMNGQEVSSIDQRIDNANSTLTYQAKNPLGQGYVLRNSTDNKLFNGTTINGTVLNGNTQSSITFPAQNTIKDVYYIVDPQTQNIVINYIDQATNKTLKTDKVSGYSDDKANYNSKSVIDGYTKQGYVVAKNALPAVLQYDHDTNKDQVYNVYLKENYSTVNDSKTINETIHYVYDNGTQAQPDYKATPITLTRTGQKNLTTGEIVWGNWKQSANQFNEVKTPAITGFTPDIASVSSIPITPNTNDINKTVTYRANDETATINFIDDTTGKIIKTDNSQGKFDQQIIFSDNIPTVINHFEQQGHELVSNNFNNQHYTNGKSSFAVHLKHKTMPVQKTKDVTRTINYLAKGSGKVLATPTKQVLHFVQNGVQDLVTTNIVWNNTTNQAFDNVKTPTIANYTTDTKEVGSQTATMDSKDSVVNVYYDTAKAVINNNQGKKPTTPENKGSVSANSGTIVAHANSINPATVVNNSNKAQLAQTNANNHSDTNVLIELGLISASVSFGMAKISKKEY